MTEPTSPDAHATPATELAADDAVAHHDAATHIDTHAVISEDDHGHAEPRLGPIDWMGWGYAVVGVAVALVVIGLLALKTL